MAAAGGTDDDVVAVVAAAGNSGHRRSAATDNAGWPTTDIEQRTAATANPPRYGRYVPPGAAANTERMHIREI